MSDMIESSRLTLFLLVVAIICKLGLLQSPCRHDIRSVWFLVDTKITSDADKESFKAMQTGLVETAETVIYTSVEPEDVRMGLITYSDKIHLTIRPEVDQSRQETLDALSAMSRSFTEADSNLTAALQFIRTWPGRNDKYNFIFIVAPDWTFTPGPVIEELIRLTSLGYKAVLFSVLDRPGPFSPRTTNYAVVNELQEYTDIEGVAEHFLSSIPCGQPKQPGLCIEADGYEYNRGNMWTAFVAHPTDCDKYVQCYYRVKDDFDLAIVRNCPMGFLWNQRSEECIDSHVEQCDNDPCKYRSEGYKAEGSCGAYYTCSDSRSQFQCCRKNHSFVPGKGCQYDPTCNDQCQKKNSSSDVCRKLPSFQHPDRYDVVGPEPPFIMGVSQGIQYIKKGVPCLLSDFNALTCSCSVSREFVCLPAHSLDFSNNKTTFAMIKQNMTGISASNVQSATSGLSFEDTSSIFINVTTGFQAFTIVFSFSNVSAISPYGQVLVSSGNVGCEGGNSLIVKATDQSLVAQLTAESLVGNIAKVRVPFKGIQNGVTTVALTYDDRHLTLSIKGDHHQYIARTAAPSNVGYLCGLTFGFADFLNSVAIYDCAVERLYDVQE